MDENQVRDEAGKLHKTAEAIEAFLARHLSDEEELAVPIILHHRLRGLERLEGFLVPVMNNLKTLSGAQTMKKPAVDVSVEENQAQAAARRAKGEFVRGVSGFRSRIGDPEFPAEPGRYHLFVAFNCPWCHRVTLARNVLGLQDAISLDVAFPGRTGDDDPVGPNFWEFNPQRIASLTGNALPECTVETGTGKGYRLVKEIYGAEGSDEGSVPVLYDKKTNRIVNNESAEIIRMLNDQAGSLGSALDDDLRPDLYPDDDQLREEIDALNAEIYANINNGAYKAGFSSDQAVYAKAFEAYFATLDVLGTTPCCRRPALPCRRQVHGSRSQAFPDALSARSGLLPAHEAERREKFSTTRICGAGFAGSMPCRGLQTATRWCIAGKGILAGPGTMLCPWGPSARCLIRKLTAIRNWQTHPDHPARQGIPGTGVAVRNCR